MQSSLRKPIAASSALVVIASIIVHLDAIAFERLKTRTGAELAWTTPGLSYGVDFSVGDPTSEALSAAARAAFDTWAIALGRRFSITYAGPSTPDPADGQSTVTALTTWDPTFGEGRRTVAHTRIVFDTRTGTIADADIFLNADNFSFTHQGGTTGAFETESVVLHEIGHLLGLAHSCGEPGGAEPSCFSVSDPRVLDAVMAPTLAPGVSKKALAPDDRAGLIAAYGGPDAPASPSITSIERPCPGDRLIVQTDAAVARIELRYATGELERLEIIDSAFGTQITDATNIRAAPASADVIVTDVSTAQFASRVGVVLSPPQDCGGEPPITDEPGGCTCASSGSAPGRHRSSWLALFAIGLAAMISRRRALAIVVAFGLVGLAPIEASAFRCSRVGFDTGPSLIWNTREIRWSMGTVLTADIADPMTTEQAIINSFDEWAAPTCSDLTLPYQGKKAGLTAGFVDGGPNDNAVVFVSSGWVYDAAIIAVTTNAFDSTSGVVFDSDIEINDQHFTFVDADDGCNPMSGAMDLQNAITHEVGHVIGLDHPPIDPKYAQATMFASAPSCETRKRTLDADDSDGLCSIYPAGRPNHQCFAPEGPSFVQTGKDDGFGCSHTGARTASVWPLLLIAALWVSRKKR